MSVVMKVVFSLSLSGSLLILVLLFCKPWLKNKLSRQWQYYIWLVVIARLLLPIASETSIVGVLFANINQMNRTDHVMLEGLAVSAVEGDDEQIFPMKEDTVIQYRESVQRGGRTSVSGSAVTEISIKSVKERLLRNLWIPWLVIVSLLLLRKITLYQSFVRYVKTGHREVSDTALLDRLAQIGEQAGVRRPVELYINSLVSSPLLIGFFRPCIILPTAELAEEDFNYTIRHELIHYRRKDMLYKWMVQLTICLHWFNPLVWLMGREINRACEFSCDEAVIGALGEKERRAYGDTLFRALGTGGGFSESPVSVTLNESAELLKERLEAIVDFKKRSRLITTISIVFTVVMMMGAKVMGAYVEPVRTVKIENVVMRSTSSEAAQMENQGIRAGNIEKLPGNWAEYLLEQYYEKDMVLQFGAVFSELDESGRREWLDTIYTDNDSGFFAAAIYGLDSSSLLIEEYLERTYADSAIDYFSILISSLGSDSPLIGEYAERAYEDDAVDFFSVLTSEMSAELFQSWQEKAAKGDMDINFQAILLDSDDLEPWLRKADQEEEEQYQEWGITKDGENYYYRNQLVRVFFDWYDGEEVIRTLDWNPAGTVDVKVTRSIRNTILSVEYMTAEEVAELFDAEELSDLNFEEEYESEEQDSAYKEKKFEKEEIEPENDVCRLTMEELPEEVRDLMKDNSKIRTWYVYHVKGRQYLCYKGFAWSYGYHLTYDENGWQIDIQRFQKKEYGDVLLALPDNGQVTVYCDGQEAVLMEIGK